MTDVHIRRKFYSDRLKTRLVTTQEEDSHWYAKEGDFTRNQPCIQLGLEVLFSSAEETVCLLFKLLQTEVFWYSSPVQLM